jgi:hypothetical protein
LAEIDAVLNPTVRSYIKEATARRFARKHRRGGRWVGMHGEGPVGRGGGVNLSLEEALHASECSVKVLISQKSSN